MKCPECDTKLTTKHYDLVKFTDDDREALRLASEALEATDPYLSGRMAGLSGRVAE
jgi:hypothetical protein